MSTIASPERPATSIQLYPYQAEALTEVEKSILRGKNRPAVVLATGGGKTLVFASLIKRRGGRAIVMTHRDELNAQAVAKLKMVNPGADVGRVQAGYNDYDHDIIVTSVQTFSQPRRFLQALPNQAAIDSITTFVTDEMHHGAAPSYQWVYDEMGLLVPGKPGVAHLGVTATPRRGDGRGLGGTFDDIVYSWAVRNGIEGGYLCNLRGYSLEFPNDDMAGVKTRAGEFVTKQLEKAVKKVARDHLIVGAYLEHARLENGSFRPTITFCVTISHAHDLAEAFTAAGVRAEVVSSEQTPEERRAILLKFHQGELDMLCNVAVLTEGYDHPPTSCIVLARPVKSQGLFLQMIGRGTRTSPGKTDCLILDVSDTARRHKIDAVVTLADALNLKKRGSFLDAEREFAAEEDKTNNPYAFVRCNTNGGREFDPLHDPLGGMKGVTFRWNPGGSGLTLTLPNSKDGLGQWLVIYPRKDLLWDIHKIRGFNGRAGRLERVINDFALPDSTSAVRFAEAYALQEFPKFKAMAGRDASWRERSEPATERQLASLRMFYKDKRVQPWMSGVPTKNQASLAIDAAIAATIRVERPREGMVG